MRKSAGKDAYSLLMGFTRFEEGLLRYLTRDKRKNMREIIREGVRMWAKADPTFNPSEFESFLRKEILTGSDASERDDALAQARELAAGLTDATLGDLDAAEIEIDSAKTFG